MPRLAMTARTPARRHKPEQGQPEIERATATLTCFSRILGFPVA
jgi:hypothetical protein